jgi:hypothetical protein
MITIPLDGSGDGSASGTTQCALPDYGGTCGGGGAGSGGKDVTYTFSYTVSTTEAQLYGRNVLLNGPFDTVLYARDVCLTSGTETNCNNNCTSWALLNCGAYGLDGNDSAFSITPPPIGTTDRVDLIVDGYTASAWGNYTVRVDRINWANNPCWDADDNQRRVDATAGGTWRGNISGYRNDIYCSDGSGYVGTPCDNQGSWGCGRSGFYGDYWHPARAWFLLAPGAAQRYCIWTNETAVSDWFDTVIEVWDNTVPGYPGGCDGWVSHVTCNAVPGRQGAPRTGATRVDLTVPAGERYMVGVSRRVWDATSTQYEIHFDLGGC